MKKKGFYEIFVVFIFVLVMLLAVFFWLMLSGQVSVMKSQNSEARIKNTLAKETFNLVKDCAGNRIIKEEEIETCRIGRDYVKAIMVRQPEMDECEEKLWGDGEFLEATKDPGVSIYTYWVSVQQTGTTKVCLAEMLIGI